MIMPHGLRPEAHELETADIFTGLGKNVEFLYPIDADRVKTPDVIIDGITWEMKSPTGSGRWTIDNQFKRAKRQSKHLIIDMRRMKIAEEVAVKEIERIFSTKRTVKRVMLVTKSGAVIDFTK